MQKTEDIVMNIIDYNKKIWKEDLIKKLKESEEEIEKGEGIEADVVFKELRQKYGY